MTPEKQALADRLEAEAANYELLGLYHVQQGALCATVQEIDQLARSADKALRRAADLRAAAQAVRAMEWRPIAEAPKDGTEVLGIHVAYWDHCPPTIYGPFTMRWINGEWQSCWEGSQVIEYVSDLSGITYRQIELEPSHWQPLPAPPEVGG